MSGDMDEQEKWELVEDYADEVQDEYGEGHFVRGDKLRKTPRISTGSVMLDACTGNGMPRGRIIRIWGHESTGKSTSALHIAKWLQRTCSMCYTLIQPEILLPPGTYERVGHYRWEECEGDPDPDEVAAWREKRLECAECGAPYHQDDRPPSKAADYYDDMPDGVDRGDPVCRDCGEVVVIESLEADDEWDHPYGDKSCACGENVPTFVLWTDFENTLDPTWAETIGVDMRRFRKNVPSYGEEGLDVAVEGIKEGAIDGWFVDSFNNFQTHGAMSDSFQKASMGTESARMLNDLFRQLPSFMFNSQVTKGPMPTIIGLNQVRLEVGGGFGTGHTSYGGKGEKFAPSVSVKFTAKDNEVYEKSIKAQDRNEYVGVETEALLKGRCDKNKTAPTDGRQFSMRVATVSDGRRRPGKIEDHRLVWRQCRETGVIHRDKNSDPWSVEGWPLTYDTQGDVFVEMHDCWWFKRHLHRESIDRILNDWEAVKRELEQD